MTSKTRRGRVVRRQLGKANGDRAPNDSNIQRGAGEDSEDRQGGVCIHITRELPDLTARSAGAFWEDSWPQDRWAAFCRGALCHHRLACLLPLPFNFVDKNIQDILVLTFCCSCKLCKLRDPPCLALSCFRVPPRACVLVLARASCVVLSARCLCSVAVAVAVASSLSFSQIASVVVH